MKGLHRTVTAHQSEELEDDDGDSVMQEVKLLPLGRVLSILLSSKPQHFQVNAASNSASQDDSSNRALLALSQHANVELRNGSDLNKLLVPLLEHVVKSRDRKNRKQVISILVWLFQDVYIGVQVVEKFAAILQSRQVNNHVRLGWCLTVQDLLQQRVRACDSSNGHRDTRLIPLVRCIPSLFDLMTESSSEDAPTRLSMMAVDCIILVSMYTSDDSNTSIENAIERSAPDDEREQINTSFSNSSSVLHVLDPSERSSHGTSTSGRAEIIAKEELLWEQLDTFLRFIFKFRKWNEKSRPLYATGLQQIAKCFEKLAYFRDALVGQDRGEIDLAVLKAALSSYWNRYGVLMLVHSYTSHTEFKVMFQQWVEGLQHSLHVEQTEGNDELSPSKNLKVEEICIFFLTCISLLLGRLSVLDMRGIIQEYGLALMQALFGQLHSKNSDVIDLAIAILRTLLFRGELASVGTLKIETVASLLMDLLDERDSVSRAVGALVADYLAMNPRAPEMERLFGILDSGNLAQRANALGVLSELLRILPSSDDEAALGVRQIAAVHLLKRLGDTELANRVEVSRLFAKLDPEFVLPALVQHLYSRDEKVQSAAGASIVSLLKGHNQPCAVLCVLLDCARNLSQKAKLPVHPGHIGVSSKESSLPDVDRIMRLIPSWACEAQGWEYIINVIISKMFSEPSNPVLPRFLSQVSSQLLENIDLVFERTFTFMAEQSMLSESQMPMLVQEDGQLQDRANSFIFERLSALLVLKVLPLSAFDRNCKVLYGSNPGSRENSGFEEQCIAQFLVERACGEFEVHEVRKLAAELLGRCCPKIILSVLKERLEHAIDQRSSLQTKSILFSLCNLILLRGKTALNSPWMPHIQTMLIQILLWPCSPADTDTYNMQHGAIDCLALMTIAELEFLTMTRGSVEAKPFSLQRRSASASKMIEEVQLDRSTEDTKCQQILRECTESQLNLQDSVLSWVVSNVIGQRQVISIFANHYQAAVQANKPATSASGMLEKDGMVDQTAFRLCMTNVLIRSTQKVATKERHLFLVHVLAPVMYFVQADKSSHIKSACLQLLFSIVHNFKEHIMSYSVDLFKLSLGIMTSKVPSEERLAATRLLAALLTSADVVMNEIAPFLSEAVMTLESISRMDSSSELRAFCEKLLDCMTQPASTTSPF